VCSNPQRNENVWREQAVERGASNFLILGLQGFLELFPEFRESSGSRKRTKRRGNKKIMAAFGWLRDDDSRRMPLNKAECVLIQRRANIDQRQAVPAPPMFISLENIINPNESFFRKGKAGGKARLHFHQIIGLECLDKAIHKLLGGRPR
jgi:hypothetical protein